MHRASLALLVVLLAAPFVGLSAVAGATSLSTAPVAGVWSEPSAGYGFLDRAILAAHRTVDVSMYELSDRTTENDLIERARHGVTVHVLLNAAYEGRHENASAAAALVAGSVDVAWAPSGTIFHAKYVVVDGRVAFVGTGNLVTYDYPSTRDFWVEVTGAADVRAITDTFDADFVHRDVGPVGATGLVWSPGSTSTLVALIGAARTTLLVENEEMDNTTIESALERAAARGVDVRVVMTYSSEWSSALAGLERAGVHVSTLDSSQIYIHAKVICADCVGSRGTVFIGSENFSIASLSYNRELGLVTTSPSALRAVETAVASDYTLGTVAG